MSFTNLVKHVKKQHNFKFVWSLKNESNWLTTLVQHVKINCNKPFSNGSNSAIGSAKYNANEILKHVVVQRTKYRIRLDRFAFMDPDTDIFFSILGEKKEHEFLKETEANLKALN